jgi:hypothetical protein
MGLDFIRSKVDRFVQKRDASKGTELNTVDLLNRAKPDHVERLFRCQRTTADAELPSGQRAIARVMSSTKVVIVQHARAVGEMLADDASELIILMRRNHRYGGILSVIVVDEPDFNGEFTVKAKSPLK